MEDRITAEGIKKRLPYDMDIEVFEKLDSTNTVAKKRLMEGDREWHTVIALCQTGGEGRLGRSFFSPQDTGLYMSCILYPKNEDLGLITGMAAVAVCEALEEELEISAQIKWVNDIFLDGKKVCGILARSVFAGEKIGVILGIGINVYRPAGGFPDDIKNTAGYLLEEFREGLRERIGAKVLKKLRERYSAIGADDAPEQYRRRCITVGKSVTVIPSGASEKAREAVAIRVKDNYHLTVRYENGEEEELSSGEVSVRI